MVKKKYNWWKNILFYKNSYNINIKLYADFFKWLCLQKKKIKIY